MKNLTKLLVVDDDEDTLIIAKYSLENFSGVTTRFADSGENAIKEILEFHPDLILLDIMMPKMDGLMTLKKIQEIPEISSTPIIFFTAKIQEKDIYKYKNLGVIDIIVKPFDPITFPHSIMEIWNHYQKIK